MTFSGNSEEYAQRAPLHLRLTKELRSTSGVSLAQEHLRTTFASASETLQGRQRLFAVQHFGHHRDLLVGADVKIVVRVISESVSSAAPLPSIAPHQGW